jgi:protein-tyrosine phosphatase
MASILVVCTGNICRSPMAEGFLRAALRTEVGDDAPGVSSAGVIGREGSPPMPESIRAASERGVDISAHVVRRLLRAHVDDADLVVTMAGEHRDEISQSMPEARRRTFTLKELVRLLEAAPASTEGAGLPALVRAADELRRSGFLGNAHDEDIVDPLGMAFESYRAVAWELEEWCNRLAKALARADAPHEPRATAGEV